MKKLLSILNKYSFVLGIILFLIILTRTNVKSIIENITHANPLYLIFALLLTFPMFTLKAWCWNYIKRKQNIKYSLKDSLIMYWSSMSAGFVTPGRIGELTKALYLKRDGYSFGKSFVGVFLDRVSDLFFLGLFVVVGLFVFFIDVKKQIYFILLIVFLIIVIVVFAIKKKWLNRILKSFFRIIVPNKYKNSWEINSQEFLNDIKTYNAKNYFIIFLITLFSYLFYYLQMYVLTKSCNLNVPFLYLAFSLTVTGLITLLPISVSGIGTRDAALILLLSSFAVSTEQIIAFSSLILLTSIFATVIGVFAWIIKPLRF